MFLNEQTAANIIKSIKPIIDFDLNIMNHTGLILASTDTGRVNTYHEAAHILIEKSLDEFIVDTDEQYHGCKKGVNLPIHFATEIIGVIGITGNPDEVIRYGRILQRMTEMLVRDYFDTSKRDSTERELLVFLNNLIYGNLDIPLADLEKWLRDISLDPEGPFTIALLKYHDLQNPVLSSVLLQANLDVAKKYIKNFLHSYHSLGVYSGEYFIVLSNRSTMELNGILKRLNDELESTYKIKLSCFVGNSYSNYLDIPKSFQEANTILHYYRDKEDGIFLYNTIVLDFTINQIPIVHRRNLHERVFGNCSDEEIKAFSNFIIEYFECNGSLNQIAENLYIHKNTVQYRIQNILKKTGFDLRKLHDLFVLYLSIKL